METFLFLFYFIFLFLLYCCRSLQPEGCKSCHRMETLNRARHMIILQQFTSTKYVVASVKEVNRLEPVIMGLTPTGYNII